ncbi:MAG: hypothetical protein AAGD86_06870 [Pseudomonadota bacterium]
MLLAVAVVLGLGACASGGPPADVAPVAVVAQVEEERPDADVAAAGSAEPRRMRRCRREMVAGTRFRKKVCREMLDPRHLHAASIAALRELRKSELESPGNAGE